MSGTVRGRTKRLGCWIIRRRPGGENAAPLGFAALARMAPPRQIEAWIMMEVAWTGVCGRVMEDQLVEFLRSRKEQVASPETNWQAKKDAWVHSVQSLYELIQGMLRDSIASKDVIVRTFDVQVTEDFIGTYSIPVLEMSVGSERVEFRPKGITVIGAAGRLDIRGESGTVTLLMDTANADSGWTVILQRVPHLRKVQLDRESLKYALERVMLPLP